MSTPLNVSGSRPNATPATDRVNVNSNAQLQKMNVNAQIQKEVNTTCTTGTCHTGLASTKEATLKTGAVGAAATSTQSGWHSETHTVVESATTLPPVSTPLPPVLNEDVTKSYMPTHDMSSIKDLITALERTSLEIDMYAKAQQDLVSREAVDLINQVMVNSKLLQDKLAGDVRTQTAERDHEYTGRREMLLKQLDIEKGKRFAEIQNDFMKRQDQLQLDARRQVDEITQRAKAKKLEIVQDAQQKHHAVESTITSNTVTWDTNKLLSDRVTVTRDELRPEAPLTLAPTEPRTTARNL